MIIRLSRIILCFLFIFSAILSSVNVRANENNRPPKLESLEVSPIQELKFGVENVSQGTSVVEDIEISPTIMEYLERHVILK